MENMQVKGRAFIDTRTNYQFEDYERLSTEKQTQRDRILNFILDNSNSRIKYVGLPGKYWRMESDLIRLGQNIHVSGFESNPMIYHKSKCMMPGKHNVISKSKDITRDIKLDIHVNKSSIYTLGSIKDLTDYKTHRLLCDISGTFQFGYSKINAIWYDFTSSFNENTYISIHNIKNIIKKESNSVICLTFLFGRDMYFNGKGEDSRIDIIKSALPEFEPIEYWKYKGFNGSTMFNVCGVIKR